MSNPTYLFDEWRKFERGLSPHYLFLWTAVLNLEAECVFEFGAGLSTRVILDALDEQGKGRLISVSTDSKEAVASRYNIMQDNGRWEHHKGLSQEICPHLPFEDWNDLVLHDGSHDELVVVTDLRYWALQRLRRFGLALIHDTQTSYSGDQMRAAVRKVIQDFDVSHVTLPYGSGLTILRCEDEEHPPVKLTRNKVGDTNHTEPVRI